jgi:hypothetical protein
VKDHGVFGKTVIRRFLMGQKTARTIMEPSHPPTIVQNISFWTLNGCIVPGVADTASLHNSSRRYRRRVLQNVSGRQIPSHRIPLLNYFQPRIMKTAMGERLRYCILRCDTLQSGRHLLLHWQNLFTAARSEISQYIVLLF